MRSRSLFTVMHMIGYRVHLLSGGYQAYRRHVQTELYSAGLGSVPIVVHGYTGSGKTAALQRIQSLGLPVLDLETCANHRGSLLGALPGGQPSQKQFESAIFRSVPRRGFFLVEGESRKIGQLSLPPALWKSMGAGIHIWVDVPATARAKQCAVDYANHAELRAAILRIAGISGKDREVILSLVAAGDLQRAAALLLELYYDPLYRRHGPEHHPDRYSQIVQAHDPAELVAKLAAVFEMAEDTWMRTLSARG